MFEMFARELHATFLRNHNTRPQRTPSRGRSSPGDTQAHKVPTSPAATTARSTGALHPIRGATPDKGHCTRTEEVHCLRIGCSAPTHKNKRGNDRTHLLPATTSPGASGGLIVPHGHCPTASVVQVARSDSCCALLILTPAATPQEPKPPQHNQGRQNSLSSQQAAAPSHHRGQARPGAETTRRYYSSSEMYPLATKRAYSLAINISSGDSTTQLT